MKRFFWLELIVMLFIMVFFGSVNAYAQVNKTADEGVAWVLGWDDGSQCEFSCDWLTVNGITYDCRWQCVDFVNAYTYHLTGTYRNGNANDYNNGVLPDYDNYSRIQKYSGFVPTKGDILIWDGGTWGHVAIVTSVISNTEIVYSDQNGGGYTQRIHHGRTMNPQTNDYWGVIRPDFKSSTIYGSEMSQGYDRVLPDGDYLIAATGTSDKTSFYYLDIEGTAVPAANQTNVSLCGPATDLPSYEMWTLTYGNDGFYTIKQMGTNMCLDVSYADTLQGASVWLSGNNGSSAQKWAISRNGSNGYRLQPKCSGAGENAMCLDIAGGSISSGTQVRQWKINNSDAQSWLFIPYMPSQPIEEGRYILLYTPNTSFEIDVAGDTGDIANSTPVQIWNDTAQSQFNSFDFIKLSNGYYKVCHAASGKCLDVTGGSTAYKSTVAVHSDNDSIAQQWAVVENGNGYSLISRCSGYALDLANGTTSNGKQLEIYPRLGNDHQRWTFVRAEQPIRYNAPEADGGIPAGQTKYYKTDLILSAQVPVRDGYRFLYWEDLLSLNENLETDHYNPGDTYRTDRALELYAVWESVEYTITYDANGGKDAPGAQTVNGTAATLSPAEPSRPHHRFLGWATDSSAAAVEYLPGSDYSGGTDVTFYAVWERVFDNLLILPGALTEIESEAFLNTNADAVVVPETVTAIDENAFDDVAVYGYTGTEAETYAAENGLFFIPITDDWVLVEEVPAGATVTDEKWTYLLASSETIKSTESSVEGWTQAGFEWKQTGSGTHVYASFPGGFDTGNSLYNAYAKSARSAAETATTKREVSGSTLKDYIYWHWCWTDYVEDSNRNVTIADVQGWDSDGKNYIYFDAFETATSLSTEGMGRNGLTSIDGLYSTYHHPEYNLPEYASWWWWRFEVRQQTYTDYQKEFTYVKDTSSIQESATEVQPQDGISNIQHWVKYEF